MEHKTVPAFIKAVDEDQGIVEHIFAVFGNVDSGLDVLHPGSFKKTIQERQKKVRVLDQHNTDSINRVLGKPLEIREIGVGELPMEVKSEFPDATGGVWAKTQFFMDTPEGKGAFIRLKEGGIDEWSFGYDAVDTDYTTITLNGKKTRVRNIRQLKLFEFSPVLWAMNEATVTLDAKDKPETKAVTPYQDYPLAARNRQWDGSAAEGRIREWAGGGDDMDWGMYAKAFMWHDGDNAETFGAYKLGYVDIIDGEPHAIPRALMAVANPARGLEATDGPTATEKERIQSHVSRYYAKMREEFDDDSLMPGWEKSDQPVEEQKLITLPPYDPDGDNTELIEALREMFGAKQETKMMGGNMLGNTVQGSLYYTFNHLVDRCLTMGYISTDDHTALRTAFDEAISLFSNRAPDEVLNLEVSEYYGEAMGYYSANPDLDEKAGRVLSASNAEKIRKALATLNEVLMAAGMIEETTMNDEDEEEKGQTKKNGPQPAPDYTLRLIEAEQEEMDLIRLS